jgi:AcrR family transcriptional regulator
MGLRERKRQVTLSRIAVEAARLATEHGVAGVTVDQIAEAADISRATFFRFYASKETAIAEGFSGPRVEGMLALLAAQPAGLGPFEAVAQTFDALGGLMDADVADLMLEQARIAQESEALQAWIAAAYLHDEMLMADVLAERLGVSATEDPRPRMVSAVAMAAIRTGMDGWLRDGGTGDVSVRIAAALAVVRLADGPT